ncbi:hypothetical protein BU25DRAFT_457548 [Macroventuria anomochaeta]|uniref:Uncharacterized protein n=1 Tax=Macroventuria anomochaeta TaxID=301207 RepID=A0ACB6S3Z0_9PLEO|nr:uncharacterized protein BU25DRAFT_457548 [Macroventuria anomochaeta]KAF2628758.1 hypothetical protein BU25DRAFT_457548 [Macroventuria anomochaeta]
MPADRVQKSRTPKDVPDLGNPDRKRVLNVLAQRRYRQRRKERIAALEAHAKGLESLVDHCPTRSDDASPQASSIPENPDTTVELISVPCEDDLPGYAIHGDPFNTSLVQDFSDFPILPTPLPSTPELAEWQQRPPSNSFAFPFTADGGLLTVPVLSMVQAFMSIATAFDICENLWDPSYLHVLPSSLSLHSSLPANLRPVPAQLIIPHHPALDLLPWPTMREKLICILAMPSKLRPPIAREEDDGGTNIYGVWPFSDTSGSLSPARQSKAITQLVQDLDDFQDGGGVRVHGNSVAWGQGNEFVEEAWEVGENFYRRWWFCLDQKIIDQSNKKRRERGLGRLRIAAR